MEHFQVSFRPASNMKLCYEAETVLCSPSLGLLQSEEQHLQLILSHSKRLCSHTRLPLLVLSSQHQACDFVDEHLQNTASLLGNERPLNLAGGGEPGPSLALLSVVSLWSMGLFLAVLAYCSMKCASGTVQTSLKQTGHC
ncbi:uncharacterized [Tachysurus ichikawai]